MAADDSSAAAPSGDQPRDIHVYSTGNPQGGPYSVEMITALRAAGSIPKNANYWRKGMRHSRPLEELYIEQNTLSLPDGVSLPEPRVLHHHFAFKWMPHRFFRSFFAEKDCGSAPGRLAELWAAAAREIPNAPPMEPDGLDSWILPFVEGTELLLVTMPPPVTSAEGYFLAVVFPVISDKLNASRCHNRVKIRYFVLSHSEANRIAGVPPGCIHEIMEDGNNYRRRDFVRPTRMDFVAELRDFFPSPPDDWFLDPAKVRLP